MPDFLQTDWRVAQVLHGDTLQKIAARETGDAARWPEIAWLNGLVPPYIDATGADARIAAGTLVAPGGRIKVPASTGSRRGVTPEDAFGVDLSLVRGDIATAGGDFALCGGVSNLEQALRLRLSNAAGDLIYHPRYGNAAWGLVGRKLTPGAVLVARRYCEETVLADPRVTSIQSSSSEAVGDSLRAVVTAEVDGAAPLRIQIEI